MLAPSIKLFKLILRLCNSDKRRWGYQKFVCQFFLDNNKMILHQARQTGKTYMASILVALYVLLGQTVIIAFPTMKQGKRLLLLEVNKRLVSLQKHFSFLKFVTNNQEEILCVNGGRVFTLTTNDTSKGREGFSASLIVIDEAHQTDMSVMDELFPTTFAQEGVVKLLLLGVGGFKNSLITGMKKQGCKVLKLTGEFIASVFEPYIDKLAEAKATLSDEGYQTHIMCEDRKSGEKNIFDFVPADLPNLPHGRLINYAGIDVGWSGDETVVTILTVYPDGRKKITDFMTIKGEWNNQAFEIVKFLKEHNVPEPYVMIEENAIGHALILAMAKHSPHYNHMWVGKNKHYLIDYARCMVRDGELAVEPEEFRSNIEGLCLTTKDDGTVDYDHSDHLSSLLMAIAHFCYS